MTIEQYSMLRHGFDRSSQIILAGLERLEDKMSEYKVFLLNATNTIKPELITEEIDRSIEIVDRIYDYLESQPSLIDLADSSFMYIKAGLLFYLDELKKAQKVVSTRGLTEEMQKVETALGIEPIQAASNDIYNKYNKSQNLPNDAIQANEVDALIDIMDQLNVLAEYSLGSKIFRNNAKLFQNLRGNTRTEQDFIFRLATIGTLLNDVYHDDLRNQLGKKVDGPINTLEALLEGKGISYNKTSTGNLRKLAKLRSTKQPIHSGEHEAITILQEFGIPYPITSYIDAGEKCLKVLLESMRALTKNLSWQRV
jgi:hypothetical protein